MARVVIDIPDDNYKRIRELAEVNGLSNNLMGYSLLAIAHGTVLPKGHGDLIDRSKLDTRERGNNSQRCMWRNIKQIIENAPTVIEGDKEKADENS